MKKPVHILLVEDNPGDVRLTQEAFKEGYLEYKLSVVTDGEEALNYLYKKVNYEDAHRPDIIFLDLNLPKKDGREVLEEVKLDPNLRKIPVVILTTSEAEMDIQKSYELHANCYITKPVDINQFIDVIRAVEDFWFGIVKLPS